MSRKRTSKAFKAIKAGIDEMIRLQDMGTYAGCKLTHFAIPDMNHEVEQDGWVTVYPAVGSSRMSIGSRIAKLAGAIPEGRRHGTIIHLSTRDFEDLYGLDKFPQGLSAYRIFTVWGSVVVREDSSLGNGHIRWHFGA